MFLECKEDHECKEKDSYNPYCHEGQCTGNSNITLIFLVLFLVIVNYNQDS